MPDRPLTASDIRWFSPADSFPLRTQVEIQSAVYRLSVDELSAWVADLLQSEAQLRACLQACMDALHVSVRKGRQLSASNERLVEQIRQLLDVEW